MLIDATDKILIDYIDTELDKLGIEYGKVWRSKYSEFKLDYEPFMNDGFIVIYKFDSPKAMEYKDKLVEEFINKREHLEKCLALK